MRTLLRPFVALAVGASALALAATPPAGAIATGRANVAVFWTNTPAPGVLGYRTDRVGVTVTSGRTSRGSYYLDLNAVTGDKGNVQLAVTHDGGAALPEPICVIRSVTRYTAKTRIKVKCFEQTTGATTDRAEFQLTYTNRNITGPVGQNTPGFVHLTTGSSAFSGSITPATQFRDDVGAIAPAAKVSRLAKGSYLVRIKAREFPLDGGVALVSAVGDVARYCNLDSWGTFGDVGPDGFIEVRVYVRCFDRFAQLANSRFSLILTQGHHFGLYRPDAAGPYTGGAQWVNEPYPASPYVATSYGFNSAALDNVIGKAATADGIVGTVDFNGTYDLPNSVLFSVIVTAYGGNHRCFPTGTGLGATVSDLRAYVICTNSSGTDLELPFSVSYVL